MDNNPHGGLTFLPGQPQPLLLWGKPIVDWYRAAIGLVGITLITVVLAEAFWFLVVVNFLNWLSATHL